MSITLLLWLIVLFAGLGLSLLGDAVLRLQRRVRGLEAKLADVPRRYLEGGPVR